MPSVRVRPRLSLAIVSLALGFGLATSALAQPGYEPTLVVYVSAPSGGSVHDRQLAVLSPYARSGLAAREEVVNQLRDQGPIPDSSEFLRISVTRPGPRTVLPIVYDGATMMLVVERPTDAFVIFVCPPLVFRARTYRIDLDTGTNEGRKRLYPPSAWVEREPIPDLRRLSEADWVPLSIAAAFGRAESVRKLAASSEPGNRDLALRALANAGLRDAVDLLLASAPKGSWSASALQHALEEASRAGHTEVVKLLLAAGANPNGATEQSDPALLLAITFRHYETVKVLLPACSKESIDRGLELTIVQEHDNELIRTLLDAGGDANYRRESPSGDRPGATVLGKAILEEELSTTQLRMLLAQEIGDRTMDDALGSATISARPEIIRLLLERRGIRVTPGTEDVALSRTLADAMAALPTYVASLAGGVLESTRLLIAAGARLDRCGVAWVLPLAHFAANGDVDDVKVLLALGADPNAPDEYGRTAIFYAIESQYSATVPDLLETVRVLLDAGADADFHDPAGLTPVRMAEERGLTTFVQVMRRLR